MKKIIFLASFVSIGLNYTAQTNHHEQVAVSSEKYTPLTEERFNQIEDLLSQQPEFIPIKIKEVPRGELIKFYISSCNDDIVSTWMDFAYKKMTKSNQVEVGSTQDKIFKRLMKLEQNRASMFQFMSSMTDEQIAAIGY